MGVFPLSANKIKSKSIDVWGDLKVLWISSLSQTDEMNYSTLY